MYDTAAVPAWPVIRVELSADDSVRVDGVVIPVAPGVLPREAAMAAVAETARLLRRAVRVEAVEPDGTAYPLVVDGDATVVAASDSGNARAPRRRLLGRRQRRASAEAPASLPGRGVSPPVARRSVAPVEPPGQDADAPEPPFSPRPFGAQAKAARELGEAEPEQGPMPPQVAEGMDGARPSRLDVAASAPEEEPEAFPSHPARAEVATPTPIPTPEQARSVQVIQRAFEEDDFEEALAAAAALDLETAAAGDANGASAARELHAYVTLLAGRAERAVRLYVDAALLRDPRPESADAEAIRMTENAHHCWLRIRDRDSGLDLAPLVLSAYARTLPSGAPAAQAVQDRVRAWM